MSVFILLLRREARLLFRRPAELANPLVFFAIVALHQLLWLDVLCGGFLHRHLPL